MDQSSASMSHIPRLSNCSSRRLLNSNVNSSFGSNHFRDELQSNKSHWSYDGGAYSKVYSEVYSKVYSKMCSVKGLFSKIKYKTEQKIRRNMWLAKLIEYGFIILIIFYLNVRNKMDSPELESIGKTCKSYNYFLEDKLFELQKRLNDQSDKKLKPPTEIENLLRSSRFKEQLELIANEKFDEIVKRNLEERLTALIKENVKSIIDNLIKYETSPKLNEQIVKRIDLVLNNKIIQRTPNDSELIDKNFLNNSIKNHIKKLITDRNLQDNNLRPDYASEFNNAIVIDASPTYIENDVITIFSIPLWSLSSSPSTILKRNPNLFIENYTKPWKMNGKFGFIKIKLAKQITPTSFSYQHLVRSDVLDENQLQCAPKVFRVFGFADENTNEPVTFGRFDFEINETTETEFMFDNRERIKISVILFNIESNHGNPDYTCLHRLKVF